MVVDGIGLDCYVTGMRANGPLVVAIPPTWVPAKLRMVDLVSWLSPIATGFTMDAPCVAGSDDAPNGAPDYFVKRYGSGVNAMSRFYLGALEQLGLLGSQRPLILVGHCGGCWTAVDLVRRGVAAQRLILTGPPPWSNDVITVFGQGIVVDKGDGLWEYDLAGFSKLHPDDDVTEHDVARANLRARRVQPLRYLPFLDPDVRSYADCVPPDVRGPDTCRTVLLHPEKDVFSLAMRQQIAADLGAELIILKGEVHDPTTETWPIWRSAIVRLAREALVDDLADVDAAA